MAKKGPDLQITVEREKLDHVTKHFHSRVGYRDQLKIQDLNQASIRNEEHADGEPARTPLADPSATVGPVSVYFRGLIPHIVEFIEGSDAVVGCLAWLTHPDVLAALVDRECVSILMNKEDFLRPDSLTANGMTLQAAYVRMTGVVRFHHEPVKDLCFNNGNEPTDPLRCVGFGARGPRPLLHHKFLVRLERGYRRWEWIPTAVWTGSINPTMNGSRSLENAVVIRNRKIAEAFYWEWGQALAISEPLDWESHWVAPEYRIGT